jgi:hypothetical protein
VIPKTLRLTASGAGVNRALPRAALTTFLTEPIVRVISAGVIATIAAKRTFSLSATAIISDRNWQN